MCEIHGSSHLNLEWGWADPVRKIFVMFYILVSQVSKKKEV